MHAETESLPLTGANDTRLPAFALTLLGLVVLAALALRFGLRDIALSDVWTSLTAFDPDDPRHVVIREIRLPRLVAAVLAGAALGMAGALMQGMTRNPLADPGFLGINAGASVGVVICILVLGITDRAAFVWVAMGGTFISGLMVFALAGGKGSAARLILAGAAVNALFIALTRGVLLISQQTLEVYRFWVLGGLDGISFETIGALLPFFGAGAFVAAVATFWLNALMLGEDTAKGLGIRVGLAQGVIGLAIVALCGATVALAGPIAFIGLMVPHLARRIAGPDMRHVVVFSALLGAGLLIGADLLGRLPFFGGNMQAGVMAALIGGPVLIWLVRKHEVRKL